MADYKTTNAPFPGTEAFWRAAAQGQLLLKRCNACGERHFYPRTHCPFCLSDRTEWEPSSGRGTLYSFSVPRKVPERIAVAVIELEEGLRLTSAIVDADVDSLAIGDAVEFYPGGKVPDVRFTTQAAQAARAYVREATRLAAEIPGLPEQDPASFSQAAVIGAGTMGTGIAMALVNAGIRVLLMDRDLAAVQKGIERIRSNYDTSVQRGRLSAEAAAERMALITPSDQMKDMACADVVIEAIWEQLGLKRQIFAAIDAHARPGALLGTNTSMLDINQIAASTKRPQDVIGLHFFTPAHAMKLLEVVRGRVSSDHTIAAAMALARRLGKAPVLVEVCTGFVGNRMFGRRESEARRLLLEGATPEQVDRVLKDFGMPMGSFELADMTSGIELGYRKRQETGERDWLGDRMFEEGRVGQKVGKGFYRYEPGGRKPLPDPEVLTLLKEGSQALEIERRSFTDAEVLDRLLLPMIDEGARILEEGVAMRSSDIDAVWIHGYGWPAYRGGPLRHADTLGLGRVLAGMRSLQSAYGDRFAPSKLLEQLAVEGRRFADLPARTQRAAAFSDNGQGV